jgi:hypothetical protein
METAEGLFLSIHEAAVTDYASIPLLVDRDTTLQLRLAPGGGQAIRLRPTSEEELGRVPAYRP